MTNLLVEFIKNISVERKEDGTEEYLNFGSF